MAQTLEIVAAAQARTVLIVTKFGVLLGLFGEKGTTACSFIAVRVN
jgi:hypothetical protein